MNRGYDRLGSPILPMDAHTRYEIAAAVAAGVQIEGISEMWGDEAVRALFCRPEDFIFNKEPVYTEPRHAA